jgi:hypothetical protein
MKKASFEVNHDNFEVCLDIYHQLSYRIVEAKHIVGEWEDKKELIEALVLEVSGEWEVLTRDDIIVSLNRDNSVYANTLNYNLPKHLSKDVCEAIIVGHKYFDFKDVDELKSFGKKHLSRKLNPFQYISNNCGKKIDEFISIRNYIAHLSSRAERVYINKVLKPRNINKCIRPGEFLLAGSGYTHSRFCDYLNNFEKTSTDMRTVIN